MESEQQTCVFVYGSLKRGHALHHYVEHLDFLGEALSKPVYRLFDCGDYPALVTASGPGVSVAGELYRVPMHYFEVLDEVEAVHEGLYARQPVQLCEPHQNLQTVAYFYRHPTDGLRDCGRCWP